MATVEQLNEVIMKISDIATKVQALDHEQGLMKDLFARAVRGGQEGGGARADRKLNYREAERHMPKEFSGKGAMFSDYVFRMESYMTILDPSGKGGELVRVVAAETRDINDEGIGDLECTYWNVQPLNAALATCLISTTTGEVATLVRRVLQAHPGAGLRAWQELNRWYRPKSAVEGSASMARIIEPGRAKSVTELQKAIMDRELKVAEHEARYGEVVLDSVKVAALKRMLTPEMAERYIEGPNTFVELRSRIANYVGEKLVVQSCAPMEIGEIDDVNMQTKDGNRSRVDEELGEVRSARKHRVGERRAGPRQGDQDAKRPTRAPAGTPMKSEKRHDRGTDSPKIQDKKKRSLVCYNCGGRGHPARLCPSPQEQPTQSVEDAARDSEDSDDDDVCGVEWEHAVETDEEDMAVMGLDRERIGNSKWQHMAAVVDSGAAENVLPTGVCAGTSSSSPRRSRGQVSASEVQGASVSATTDSVSLRCRCPMGRLARALGKSRT